MAEITLTDGAVVLLDDSDVHLVEGFSWTHIRTGRIKKKHYAMRSEGGRTFYMHRVIMDAPKGLLVDHINGDGLDNRRANLRLATPSQNAINSRRQSKGGLRGVYKRGRWWVVQIDLDGQNWYPAKALNAEDAARIYDEIARNLYGEFAVLNFPNDTGWDHPDFVAGWREAA